MPGKARKAELRVSAPGGSTPCALTASTSHGDPARQPRTEAFEIRGARGEKPCQQLAPPALTQGPTCKGKSPKVTRADHSPEGFQAGTCHQQAIGGKGFHGLGVWCHCSGGRAEANRPGAGLGISTPGWEFHPGQCQPVILTNTQPVPSTFILLRKHLIGIQARSLLNNPTSYDLCDVFVFRHCCQQYPFSGKAADACRFPKVSLMDTPPLLKDNKQKL